MNIGNKIKICIVDDNIEYLIKEGKSIYFISLPSEKGSSQRGGESDDYLNILLTLLFLNLLF